ncbi:transferrin receptor-like dimerization domain-containing protein [Caulobacter sp. S45]|uniref:transferrin receptor-like dimerization domain-containing protein n=1 Tax=Caulobacter sp. S45 TaxID=1641861 RepID=UPI00131C8FB7|nr:transferrin receptor-like dimerization domain-containing protein [Caulobacter sp. S45]
MPLRRLACVASLSLAALAVAMSHDAIAQDAGMLGFTAGHAAAEHTREQALDASVSTADLDAWLLRMASGPNQVGAPHDRDNAEWQLQQFKAWGWDAHIETFQVLYPTPISESLELLGPHPYTAKLHEPAVVGDRTSADMPGVLPPYLAYQGDGDVTAPLVYVNFGMPDDYKALARQGVDVRGKIVIARYGGGWRGLKPKLAQQHGAVGCIIYSDPHEDGYYSDDIYPKGPQRPPEGVQRGSVNDIILYSGDPLTPGVGATADAKRLTRETAPTLMKIPAIPISYADALPLLQSLGGPLAEPSFRGALPITYHLGPGPMVHLAVKSDWSLKPLYDVVATMKGSEHPDQWVVRGNHHDGWVFGAEDPLSGQVALMAEAKAIGQLAKTGWKPKRTLVYTSWDGEEPGLLGSTEWAEQHADELQKKAVVYINSDNIDRGFLRVEGSHELQRLSNEIAGDVKDPETGVTLLARQRARALVEGQNPTGARADEIRKEAKAAASGGDLPIGALGSGSDYTPFLQHLGIASLNVGFGGEAPSGGEYHSAYDTYDHYTRFDDPGMKYSAALARTVGRFVLRYADADAAPVDVNGFAETVGGYVDELHKLADHAREQTVSREKAIKAGAYTLAADPMRPMGAPELEAAVPPVAFAPLDQAAARLKASAAHFQQAYSADAVAALPTARRAELEKVLQSADQALMDPAGLPGRPWYQNMIYAPGMETGYGVKTVPGVREAIEGRRWAEADHFAEITARSINAYSDRLDKAAALLTR